MKNKHARTLAATCLLVLFSSSTIAQSAAEIAECDRIRNAADSGRTRAVDRLNNIEDAVRQQVATARSCLQRFGDQSSRQAVSIAGFDVSFLRDALFESACNVMRSNGSTPQLSSLNTLLSKVPGFDSSGSPLPQAASVLQPIASQQQILQQQPSTISAAQITTPSGQSLWDVLSCRLLNSCIQP